ncbi:MAG: glycosyltransferase [Planctomycetes bacterium]|nr:glycosyltransferase [Planctomycetota bacterium]
MDRITADGVDQIVVVGEPGDQAVHELARGPVPVTWVGQRRGASVPALVRTRPGTGPQALAELRGRMSRRTLYLLCGNGLDPEHVRQSLYMLSRGEGVLIIPLGTAAGPNSYDDVRDQLLLWCPEHRLDVVLAGEGNAALVVEPRRAVHVTFVMERYTDRYGVSAPSINFDNMVATLTASGQATHDILLHDEFHHQGRTFTDDDLCPPAGADEHVIVLTYNFVDDANPPLDLLERARARGSKIVYLWLDKHLRNPKPGYAEAADLNVIFDCTDFELPRSWPCFTTKNPMFFNDPGMVRDLDLSVLGEMRFLKQRKDLLPRLQAERRLSVYAPGTSSTCPKLRLEVEDYARIYKRSKISLVLTKDRVRQLKGRIFEVTLCGAMLLCDTNPHIHRFFEPNREYVPFHDYEELVAACRYYLEHDDERRAIAAAGCRKATRFYHSRVFWSALFARLFAERLRRVTR